MKNYTSKGGFLTGILLLCLLLTEIVYAAPPFSVNLIATKSVYLANEPVKMQINLVNSSNGEVYVDEGFWGKNLHLALTFIAPDTSLIRTNFLNISDEPLGSTSYCKPIEIVPAHEGVYRVIPDVRDYYDLTKCGLCTAQVKLYYTAYSSYEVDEYGKFVGCPDQNNKQDFNPQYSNTVSFQIAPYSTTETSPVKVKISLRGREDDDHDSDKKRHKRKKVRKKDVLVHLYKISDIQLPLDEAKYSEICDGGELYSSIWANISPVYSGTTNYKGEVFFQDVPRDDYLALAYVRASKEFRFVGGFINTDNKLWGTNKSIAVKLTPKQKDYWEKEGGKRAKYMERLWRKKWKVECKEHEKEREEWKEKRRKWKKLKKNDD